jgi:DNA-binding response OmpR family regulator
LFSLNVRIGAEMADATFLIIVEEDELLLELSAFRLELLGYRVTRLSTGEDLIRELANRENKPDLVILDTTLPDMDGIELVHRLKSDSRTANVPVLLLSIDADLDIVQRAVIAGATDYLVIPFDPTILEQKVESVLVKSRQLAAI